MATNKFEPNSRRALFEYDTWSLTVDLAIVGPHIYKDRMRELVQRWRKVLFITDYKPTLYDLNAPLASDAPIELLEDIRKCTTPFRLP